jgi:hypothetical protein
LPLVSSLHWFSGQMHYITDGSSRYLRPQIQWASGVITKVPGLISKCHLVVIHTKLWLWECGEYDSHTHLFWVPLSTTMTCKIN